MIGVDSDDEDTVQGDERSIERRSPVAESDVAAQPAKRRKTTAMVSTKPHTIYAVTDEHGQYVYIGSTSKDKMRGASLGVGAPMLIVWIKEKTANYPDWDWSQHIKTLARNVPAHRVCAFKTMLMSDNKTFWVEGNGKCNMHAQGVAGIEHTFPSMREELEKGFGSTTVTSLQAAEADVDIMADIETVTRDEANEPIPSIHNALIERNQSLQALIGSPFEQAVKKLLDKYHKVGDARKNSINLENFIIDLNNLYDDHNLYVHSSHLEESMHEEVMSVLKRLRVATGMGTTTPAIPMTYNLVHERLKLLMSAVRHRDNINGQSFQSQMAWTQPTFKHKQSRLPQGYEAAIGHANKTLDECKDLTTWQRNQMKERLKLLLRMQRNDEPITSCPIPRMHRVD